MILVLIAFYLMHTLVWMMLHSDAGGVQQRKQDDQVLCDALTKYVSDVMQIAFVLLLCHVALIIPNCMRRMIMGRRCTISQVESRQFDNSDDSYSDSISVRHNISNGTYHHHGTRMTSNSHSTLWRGAMISVVALLLLLLQRVAWVATLLLHLYINWTIFVLVKDDGRTASLTKATNTLMADLHGAETGASALSSNGFSTSTANSMDAPDAASIIPFCGSIRRKYLILWSVITIILTTALTLSLLIATVPDMIRDGWQAVKQNCLMGGATASRCKRIWWQLCGRRFCRTHSSRHTRLPHSSHSPPTPLSPIHRLLDLQSDHVRPNGNRDYDGDEDDDDSVNESGIL